MVLNKELVDILACPACKGGLTLLPEEDGLACEACQKVYPIMEEIPVMLEEESVALADWHGSRPS